jgi:hypothetical protein
MRTVFTKAMAAALVAIQLVSAGPALANRVNPYEVYGVQDDDMLKLRAAPGTGNKVLLGLPNGTLVRIIRCQMIGGTNWCKVYLDQAPGMRGYVSDQYLREKP